MRSLLLHIRSVMMILTFGIFIITLTDCARFSASSDDDSVTEETVSVEIVEEEEEEAPVQILTVDDAHRFMDTCTQGSAYRSGIIPQMLEDAPDYAIRLLKNNHDRFIVVDKYRMKVIVFNKFGVEEESFGMACAKNYGTKHKKADSRTPEGFFSVHGIYDSTEWLFTDDEGNTSDKKGQFGPRFIRLNIPTTSQIGIHGTSAPWSIGGRSSHGCIRILNENIMKLVELVDSGMPVIITPGLKDMEVNRAEGFSISAISTVVGRKAPVLRETVADNDVTEEPDDTTTMISPFTENPVALPADSTAVN